MIENAHLKHTVMSLVELLRDKGVLTEEEAAALISSTGLEQLLGDVRDDTQPAESVDVSPELEALGGAVEEHQDDAPPIGER